MNRTAIKFAPPALVSSADRAAALVGQICTFFPVPAVVVGCVAPPNALRYAGTITAAMPAPPLQPGNVPDYTVTIKGRTGKVVVVSLTLNYVSLFPSWEQALDTL